MKEINKFAFIISLTTLIFIIFFYEWYVSASTANEIGAVIRVDIIMVYPIIFALSYLTYWIFKRIKTTKEKIFLFMIFIFFWIVFAGMFKFNILANLDGYNVDGNLIESSESTLNK